MLLLTLVLSICGLSSHRGRSPRAEGLCDAPGNPRTYVSSPGDLGTWKLLVAHVGRTDTNLGVTYACHIDDCFSFSHGLNSVHPGFLSSRKVFMLLKNHPFKKT